MNCAVTNAFPGWKIPWHKPDALSAEKWFSQILVVIVHERQHKCAQKHNCYRIPCRQGAKPCSQQTLPVFMPQTKSNPLFLSLLYSFCCLYRLSLWKTYSCDTHPSLGWFTFVRSDSLPNDCNKAPATSSMAAHITLSLNCLANNCSWIQKVRVALWHIDVCCRLC